MKTDFELDAHKAELSGSKIAIIGTTPASKPYVRIELSTSCGHLARCCLFIYDRDLERFAVNILKALKSKKLKQ